MEIRRASYTAIRAGAGAAETYDLKKKLSLTGLIKRLVFTLIGQQVSTGGGAITGFSREAPWPLISLLTLQGNFQPKGGENRIALSGPPADLYWPMAHLSGSPPALLTTSSGAAATDPIRGVLPIYWADPASELSLSTYLDTRLYDTLDLMVEWAANAALASTNLSTVQNLILEVYVEELVGADLPDKNAAHFEPFVLLKQHATDRAETDFTDNGELSFDGLVSFYHAQQHDASAAGNLQRVDGITRKLGITQGSKPLLARSWWNTLLRESADEYPLGYTTAQPAGVVAHRPRKLWDSRKGKLNVDRDSNTASQTGSGLTDVVAAAGDQLKSVIVGGWPNPAMRAAI